MTRSATLLFLALVASSFAGTEGVVLDDVTKQVKNPMVIFGADTTIDVTDATKIGFPSGGGGGAVASVFGRTGAVTAQSGDYSFSLISGLLSFGQLDRTSTVVAESATITIAANTRIKTTATGTLTTFAFSGGNNAAQARRIDIDVSGGPFTITIPTTRRIGDVGSVNSLILTDGYHEISWEYIAGEYVMADSLVSPLAFTNLVDVPSSYVGQSLKLVRVNSGETGLEFTTGASGGGSGDVVGPSSATDNAIARFDGTTGKLIQNSGAAINDSGNLTATNFSGSSSGTNTGDQDLSGLVPNTRTVNGHALSSNITVTPADLSLVIGTNVEAWDADLDTWATKTPYAGSLTITTGKTFNVTNTLTLSGTDASTLNIGGGGTLGTAAFTASSAYQPIDSDLTAIAALVTDSFGRDLLIKTSAVNVRSYIGAGTSSFDGAFSSLTGTPTTLSGYGITDAQPLDSDLTSIAGLTATTDNFMVSVANVWASRTPSQVRTTLGLVIGTNVEAWDADLDTWATLTPSANFQTLVAHTFSQMRTDLGLVIGTNVQAWDTQLDSLAGLSYTGNSLKVVRVNAGETGFELATPSAGGTITLTGDTAGSGTSSIATTTHSASQDFALSGTLTPSALSADINDYNPTNLSTASILRIDGGAADRNVTGLSGGVDGRIIGIVNIGTPNSLLIKEQNASSSAANRFLNGADITVGPNKAVVLRYDGTSSRWRTFDRALVNTGVTAGSYGDSTHIPSITFDVQGRATSASNNTAAITIAGTSVGLGGSISVDTIDGGLSSNGLVKRTGANARAIAVAGTDYDPAPTIAFNANAQSITAATDTYITSSGLSVPASIHVGTTFKWHIRITKTAVGTATVAWNIRWGTAGTTADTSRISATSVAQTTNAEVAVVDIEANVTATGASGTILGIIKKNPGVAASGIGSIATQSQSSAFDTTVGSSIIGVSVNSGASAVWTVDNIKTEIIN